MAPPSFKSGHYNFSIMNSRTAQVEFTPPKGSVPEGVEAGSTFSLVCDFRVKPSGKVCLTKFGEVDMDYDRRTGEPRQKHDDMPEMGGKESMGTTGGGY